MQAEQTRNRILERARGLFQAEGFECVTIEKIAQVAEVSGPTIYALFQSKRGLLRALMDEALPSDQYKALMEEVEKDKAPKEHLMLAAKIARQMYDAERAQMDIFHGASVLAPEFKELEKEREKRRYQRLEETIKMIAKEKAFIDGLTISKAHDILWAFTGRDLYRMLVIEQGWFSEEYEKWLAQHLIKSLIR
ncbi:MAG: TetR/AcrR family transcriptional regulator [Parachlamydiaceae bacterium]|nr:TetR/AcrR family transcriptional regulator [Parachlamydiaceae bacterium]